SLADLLYPIRSHGCASDPDKDPVMEKDGRLPPQSNGGRSYRRQKNLSNPEPNLRIFIAGAAGVVGRRVVHLLVAAGHRVTAVAPKERMASRAAERAGKEASHPRADLEAGERRAAHLRSNARGEHGIAGNTPTRPADQLCTGGG